MAESQPTQPARHVRGNPRTPDMGAHRRRVVLAMLSDEKRRASWQRLRTDAQLSYVLGALVCDDAGRFDQVDLLAAWCDPSAVQYARHLLAKAGAN